MSFNVATIMLGMSRQGTLLCIKIIEQHLSQLKLLKPVRILYPLGL